MRIGVIHSFYQSSSPSGENQAVLAQVEALEASGHEVQLISQKSDDLASEKLPYRASSAWRVSTGYGSSPGPEIHAFRPDVVHVHNLFPNWGHRWLEETEAPVVLSIHNFRPLCAAGTLYRSGAPCTLCPTKTSLYSLAHGCYRNSVVATIPLALATAQPYSRQYVPNHVSQIVFLSEHQRRTYQEFGEIPRSSTVVPNFVPEVRTQPSFDASPFGWCYIGRISEEKGVFDLVRYWPEGVHLSIYGDGPGVPELSGRLNRDISYGGPLPNEQVDNVLRRHQGLVFPSKVAEVSPLVYMESLRAGRPVVAFEANAAARDIRANGGRGGEVFKDWDDLAKAVEALSYRPNAGREAREVYEEKFSTVAWLRAIESVYESVIERASNSG